ncbi:glucose repression mediator protein, variant 2 [Exophiala dermatitidis]|nr:glucose repression mediator protein, variant 2 [Exophiala dermatitidis]
MAQQKFPKAYEAYQQAVYRDGRNPTFWCSIGVLYYQINQYRDALDAYSRAIRLNPYISEVWYDLGTLYESCNNQTSDALDAYARAAELDPTNTHIKARLALLRSGVQTGPNQHNAPVPQDVHPQAYQNGVGVPPGPQWGAPSSNNQQSQQAPVDPARVSDWTRGIAGIQQPPQPNGLEGRDSMRAPPPRAPSPRQEASRPYDSARQTPSRKRQSPSPKLQQQSVPGMYAPGPQTLPQVNLQDRGPGFNGGVRPSPTMSGAPPPPTNGNTPGTTLPPYGRPFSPPSELRPLRDEHPQSPGATFRQQPYHSGGPFPSIANGMPSAAPPLPATAEGPARDERPPSAMKRSREWEGEQGPSKKLASEETRARLDDPSRRNSPPGRLPTPKEHFRRSSSEVRRENERRANENYHPSEAAHHPYSLPPQQIPSMQSILDGPKEAPQQEHVEQAARKVDVDEDYDNNSEDDKRAAAGQAISSPQVGGPQPPPSATPKTENAS